jgi:photosystem II stability/assembly factor-like uncharacterized protein
VVRSVDAGKSWSQRNGDLGTASIASLAFGPAGTLYAGVHERGLFISNDGGRSWIHSEFSLDPETPHSIASDPHDAQTVYVGTRHGLWKTTDGGAQWHRLCPWDIPEPQTR